jgi:hypothetical protein
MITCCAERLQQRQSFFRALVIAPDLGETFKSERIAPATNGSSSLGSASSKRPASRGHNDTERDPEEKDSDHLTRD